MNILSFVLLPVARFVLCRDSLDCPQYHVCVPSLVFNYCREVRPTYRPRFVTVQQK